MGAPGAEQAAGTTVLGGKQLALPLRVTVSSGGPSSTSCARSGSVDPGALPGVAWPLTRCRRPDCPLKGGRRREKTSQRSVQNPVRSQQTRPVRNNQGLVRPARPSANASRAGGPRHQATTGTRDVSATAQTYGTIWPDAQCLFCPLMCSHCSLLP